MRAAGLALISLCLGISLMPGLALTSVESGLPATGTSPARPVTLLRPVLALKETLRRNQLFEVLRSSESPVVSRARDCGVSIGRLILQLVQFAAIFVFNVAGCFVGMCWWLSPDSTIFGLFELHTEDDGNKIPAPLTTNSKRALAVCLVCSIALPIGTNVWELYKHIANTTMSTPLEDSSATATTETPTLQETSAPSTREPRIFSSLLLRGISGVLGGLGFLLLSFLFANGSSRAPCTRRIITMLVLLRCYSSSRGAQPVLTRCYDATSHARPRHRREYHAERAWYWPRS
eukprot:3101446-Rhodomonas_salina.1